MFLIIPIYLNVNVAEKMLLGMHLSSEFYFPASYVLGTSLQMNIFFGALPKCQTIYALLRST